MIEICLQNVLKQYLALVLLKETLAYLKQFPKFNVSQMVCINWVNE